MRKVLLAGLLLLVAGMSGCGNAAPEDPGPVDPSQADENEILRPQGAPPFEPTG